MSKVYLIECRVCGKPHYPVSLEDAAEAIESFNQYYNTLSPADQQRFFGGRGASLDAYTKCSKCGSDRFQKRLSAAPGETLNPIIYGELDQ